MSRRRQPVTDSVLAAYFANHSHGSGAEHLPDAFHGSKVPVKFALKSAVRLWQRSSGAPSAACRELAVRRLTPQWGTIQLSASRHELCNHITPMTSASMGFDPWPLLRNCSSIGRRRPLRLVVHGRSGGELPACVLSLAESVQERRAAPVQIDVLTATHQSPRLFASSWLIPILLWPGAHVCVDIPCIRQRLRLQGENVINLPFLGAWPQWWDAVAEVLSESEPNRHVLLHHPLRQGVANRFLQMLASRFALPMVPFDRWAEYHVANPSSIPLPLALAPNRMTEMLRDVGGLPPLLNHSFTRQTLIDLLASLP